MLLYMAILDKKERLWIEYSHSKSTAVREELIMEYVSLVKLVAGRLAVYLGANVEYDDLVSYGIFGLIDAIDKFDYGKGIKFETYASLRIRGSILDQIRKMDWIPRSVRQKQKSITEASKKLRSSCPVKAVEAPLKNGEKYGIMGASAVQNLPPEERMGRTHEYYGIPRRA